MLQEGTNMTDINFEDKIKAVMGTMASCASSGYPIADKGKASKSKIHAGLVEFWKRLPVALRDQGCFTELDNPLEAITGWVITMSRCDTLCFA